VNLTLLGGGGGRAERAGPIRASAMYRVQEALGARFTDDAGWLVADVYTGVDDEIARARSGVGLCDVSACGKLGVRGEAVESCGSKVTGSALPAVGRAAWERVNGVSVLVCRRAADELLLLTPPREVTAVAGVLDKATEDGGCVHVTDLTAAFAVVDLIGDKLGPLLERLVALDVSVVPPLGVIQGDLAGVHAIMLRLDHQTLPVFRVLVGREYGDFVWRALSDAGHDLGLTPVGAAAYARMMSA
jgi:glycine cleavage system aminomethyltransferase T